MAAEEDNDDIVRFIYRGQPRAEIPDHVTHVTVKDIKVVPVQAFCHHRRIVEVICDDVVKKIEKWAFWQCPRLRRVIIPGVKIIEQCAFYGCGALLYIECGKLEIIGEHGFRCCQSLNSIDLPSIKVVENYAFDNCTKLTNTKFGTDLESIGAEACCRCTSLERISLPLKDGAIDESMFRFCKKLGRVDLVGGVHETISALLYEGWRNDMNSEIDFINRVLAKLSAGNRDDPGGKARAIRRWVRFALRKIVRYKAEHRRYVNEAAATLQLVLPHDIVLKNVLPFLELPSHTFDGED